MEVFVNGAACPGRIGRNGCGWLIKFSATAESCQEACLKDASCQFATLYHKNPNARKWRCAKFKVCKISKKLRKRAITKPAKAVSYKKTSVKAS